MDIDDKDFFVVRKNLNILSVLIMVLAFSNARIHDLNFLGIQVDLEGSKLYVALYILYLYMFWRFVTKMPFNSEFKSKFIQYYLDSTAGVKEDYSFARYKDKILNHDSTLKYILDNDPNARLVETKAIRLTNDPLRKVRLSITFYKEIPINNQNKSDHSNYTADFDFTVSRFYVLRKFISFCLKHDKFGDVVFPVFPVITNLTFLLFKSDWQGSLWNLLK